MMLQVRLTLCENKEGVEYGAEGGLGAAERDREEWR